MTRHDPPARTMSEDHQQEDQEPHQPHQPPRFWTARAQAAFASASALLDDRPALLEAASEALRLEDAEALCGVLRAVDETDFAGELRFWCAIRAMDQRKYLCGVAAWEDGGACWTRTGGSPFAPSSSDAVEVLIKVCLECAAAAEAEADRDAAGISADIDSMRLDC